jgi:hypothetical protein
LAGDCSKNGASQPAAASQANLQQHKQTGCGSGTIEPAAAAAQANQRHKQTDSSSSELTLISKEFNWTWFSEHSFHR